MTPAEFVLAIEDYWKPLAPKNQRLYVNKVGRFNPTQLDCIFDRLLEDCQWTPKIKDIFDAARNLGFLQASIERKTLGNKACRFCEGIGFRYITKASVVPCECKKRGKAIHAA